MLWMGLGFWVVRGLLATGAAAAASDRPAVDVPAMQEAMRSSKEDLLDYPSSAAYAHYLAARVASEEGDHRRAIQELRLALASDDGEPALVTSLAEEYVTVSEPDRALQELSRLLQHASGYAPAHVLMGRILLEQKKYASSAEHLNKAIKLRPEDPDSYLLLAQLQLERNETDQAVKTIERQVAANPDRPIGYKRLGLALADRRDLARAEQMLKKAAQVESDDFEIWTGLAQIYQSSGRLSEAEKAFEKALETDPENRDVLLAIGAVALKAGAATRARAYFDRVLYLSREPEYTVRVAFAYLANGNVAEALQILDNAREQSAAQPRLSFYAGLLHERLRHYLKAAALFAELPTDSDLFQEARIHQASCLSQAGEHARAEELFQAAIKDKPDFWEAYAAYATALERAGAVERAEALLNDAIRRKAGPTPAPELFESLAGLYGRHGRSKLAIQILTDALRKSPKDETLLFALGSAYQRQGETDTAIAQMQQVLAVNPDNASAMNFIGYTLAESGKHLDRAEKLIRRALELQPDSGAFMDSLGWVYFHRGQYPQAIGALERAVERDPDPMILEHLGDAYRSSSKKAQAGDVYRRALDALKAAPELQESPGQAQNLERKLKMLSRDTADR